MADLQIESLKRTLRDRLSEFVSDKSAWRYHPVYGVLRTIYQYGKPAFLCGGAVRDILLHGRKSAPRDLDIILEYLSENQVESLLKTYKSRRTKFGGISIKVIDWSLDIWPLMETWAFKEQLVRGICFADFPKTTFFDIDAIAIELFTKRGRMRKIYSKGFFEAILNKTIDINFEENPYPAVCIVKSLANALRFRFRLGRRLAEYIIKHSEQIDAEEMATIYQTRYQDMMLSAEKFNFYVHIIKKELRARNDEPIRLPLLSDKAEKGFLPSTRYNRNIAPSLFLRQVDMVHGG
jgi:hypothetical protein